MNKLLLLSAAGTLGLAAAIQAQSQATPDPAQQTPQTTPGETRTTETQTRETQDTQSQSTGQEQERSPATTTPGTVSPRPQTSPTEGTAADRTPPGATETRDVTPGTVNPMPATSRAEGTAADRTPPGETPVRGTAAEAAPPESTARMAAAGAGGMSVYRASNLMGMQVQSTQGERLGKVKDVLIDQNGQVTHVVLDSQSGQRMDQSAQGAERGAQGRDMKVIPWSAIDSAGGRGDIIVVDRSSVQSAPNLR